MKKWVFLFEEASDDKSLFGSKGVGLFEMMQAGLPIPPGLVVTTEACNVYYANNKQFPDGFWEQVTAALQTIETKAGKKFGDAKNPLLVSVRAGAALSMPGLMDTVLNLGLNEETVLGLAEQTGDLRFALDTYRRFASLFGEIVIGVAHEKFERVMDRFKALNAVGRDTNLKVENLREIIAAEKEIICGAGRAIPNDPYDQLRMAIAAAFNSWMGRRAIDYRRFSRISDDLGTAVNVQAMVFGNLDANSGTGVAFTRNPSTGKKELYGEYLLNAQGEEVVSGIRTPAPISQLREEMPGAYDQLFTITGLLEKYYRDMQDLEFTIERGKVWLLETRRAKRTGCAGLQLVLDFLDEGLITQKQALRRIAPAWIAQRFAPTLEDRNATSIAVGLPASPGIAIGVVALTSHRAKAMRELGKKVVFVCLEVNPDYFDVLIESEGVMTLRGGMTSHAAVICRGLQKPCVSGVADIEIDDHNRVLRGSFGEIREGELVTIDGYTGRVFAGALVLTKPPPDDCIRRIGKLVWTADPVDYLDDDLGSLWQIRDLIRDQGVGYSALSNLAPYKPRTPQQVSQSHEDYISFTQPLPSLIITEIIPRLHWNNGEDTNKVSWSIFYELLRQLQNEIGIGNHPVAIRPLNDPELTFFNRDSLENLPRDAGNGLLRGEYQLIGIEFFGINRFLRHGLPWSVLQWWGAVRIDPSLGDAWQLDRINSKGESLVARSHELAANLVILDDEGLSIDETRRWYQSFRQRELAWSWYKDNNLTRREVVESVQAIKTGLTVSESTMKKLQGIGLLSAEMELTPQGMSLIESQTAGDRKQLSFEGRVLTDV